MNYTENYNLKKPAQTDYYDVDDFNANADTTDAKLKDLYDRKAEIATGSYTGTGKAGGGVNTNSITFDFTPSVVLIQSGSGAVVNATAIINGSAVDMYVQTSEGRYGQTASYDTASKKLTWYYTNGQTSQADRQANANGYTYTYVAIGKL